MGNPVISRYRNLNRSALALSPVAGVLIALALLILVNSLLIIYMFKLPWLGFDLGVSGNQVIYTGTLHQQQPLLKSGTQIIAIANQHDTVVLQSGDLIEEPDLHITYQDYNHFMQRQQRLFRILQSPTVDLQTAPHGWVSVNQQQTSITDLPLIFWIQLLVAGTGFMAGSAVWLFRQQDRAAFQYFLTGLFLALAIYPAAIYSSRELALPTQDFRLFSVIDHLGLYLLMAAIISLLWSYPSDVKKWPVVRVIYLIMAGCWVADTLQWFPNLNVSTRVIPVVVLFCGIAILMAHWRKSSGDTLYRQSIKWFLLVIVLGCGLFILTVFIPPLFGASPLVSQSVAFIAFLSIYLSLAVGVARYKLFNLDRWWYTAWLWVVTLLIMFVLDVLFVFWLSLSGLSAFWLAMVSVGWLYFPLRQWFMQRMMSRTHKLIGSYLPMIVRSISQAAHSQELIQSSQSCLLEMYQPLSYQLHDGALDNTLICENGLSLRVELPGERMQVLEMRCPEQGRQLFRQADVENIDAVIDLFQQAMEAREDRDMALREERERIKQDMHDSLGGSLLSIMRQQDEPKSAARASMAWRELRDILSVLEGSKALLGQALLKWQQDTQQQIADYPIKLQWQVDDALREMEFELDGFQRLNLGQILRELVTNALRHAESSLIKVRFSGAENRLQFRFYNNGVKVDREFWVPGRGLLHIQHRAHKLGADINWRMAEPDAVEFRLSFELAQ
jgi:signal transduction histidine kinase